MSRPVSEDSGESRSRLVVAAIDFGTTCTGYAYSFRKDKESHLHDINNDQAWIGSSEVGLQAPTTVLMKPDKSFHSFGFEAEAMYKKLTLENKHSSWYYFQYFKMTLHHEKELSRKMSLKDEEGKTMKAMTVFSEAIKYVKNHLLTKLKNAVRDEINHWDIQWVITVPAIWRESAKQFMREATSKAGIPNDQLLLALEPESAAIFCKEMAMRRSGGISGNSLNTFNPGEEYIVLDLGGGTVDITGYEVLEDGTLKELHTATGGPWGGQMVNTAFDNFMEELVTPSIFRTFREKCKSDWTEFQKDFERKKRAFSTETEQVDLNFPVDLESTYKDKTNHDLRERVEKEYKGKARMLKHSLILTKNTMLSFFESATNPIIHHIKWILRKVEFNDVSSILLVGGFSESPIVSANMRRYFSKQIVISPGSAGSVILKGAVMYGFDQKAVASRLSPYTYGVHTRKKFDPSIHPEEKKVEHNGKYYVNNAFDKHIERNEDVYVGKSKRECRYEVINRNNTTVYWNMYQTEDKNPIFCYDEGCTYIGRLEISIPKEIKDQRVSLVVSMTCRGTELHAQVVAPGHQNIKCQAYLNFLEPEKTVGSDFIESTSKG